MTNRRIERMAIVSGLGASWLGSAALAQQFPPLTASARDAGGDLAPSGTCDVTVAALPYDGSSTWGWRGQDYESPFELYDTFLIEDFVIDDSYALHEFVTEGFGSVNPFATTDLGVRIFENNGTGLPGEDGYTGRMRMSTPPGVGFYDGTFHSDFGGQCLPAGSYYLVVAVRLEFTCCGSAWFFNQPGEHAVGGGQPNTAWFWNPGLAYGLGTHTRIEDAGTGEFTGTNFVICGERIACDLTFCQADLTGSSVRGDPSYGIKDGDIDADDFFFYLDFFLDGDSRASLNGDHVIDADDFFTYLDWYAAGCD